MTPTVEQAMVVGTATCTIVTQAGAVRQTAHDWSALETYPSHWLDLQFSLPPCCVNFHLP